MRRIWAGPRPSALLRAGVRLSRGPLTLPCCAPLPSVVPFPSFPHSPDTPAAQRDPVPRAGPPHCAPCANAALRSSLLRPSSLGLLRLQSLHSASLRYRKPTPRPASRRSASRPSPTHRTATRPRKAPKRPSRRPSVPPDAAAGHRLKMPATCPQSLRSGHAGQRIRPASRRVSLGSTPSPRQHALAAARSSSSASAAEKSRSTLKRPAPPSNS